MAEGAALFRARPFRSRDRLSAPRLPLDGGGVLAGGLPCNLCITDLQP
jgi:hypothetical protein